MRILDNHKMLFKIFFLFLFTLLASFSVAEEITLSDTEIRKIMIKESVSRYQGNRPCPYYSARNGSRCGKRSAWSRGGGYSPLCYERDITDEMLKKYKKQNLK